MKLTVCSCQGAHPRVHTKESAAMALDQGAFGSLWNTTAETKDCHCQQRSIKLPLLDSL